MAIGADVAGFPEAEDATATKEQRDQRHAGDGGRFGEEWPQWAKLTWEQWMLIPRELKRNLSRFERELVNRRQMIGLGIVLYAVLLIPFSKFPNGWVRVIPFLGRPVRGSSFSYHTAL